MSKVPIAFQSAEGRYNFEGVAQLFNAYAEKRDPDAKAPLSVLPCDGLLEFVDTGAGPCRGMIFLPDLNKAYSVHPNSCYKITFSGGAGVAERIGTVPGDDEVQLSRNQKSDAQVIIAGDTGLQIIESDAISYVTDVDLPSNPATATFCSNYTVVGYHDRTFFISAQNDAKLYDAEDFATFQQRAGVFIRVDEQAGELYGFGDTWFEVWRNTGNVDFPFEPLTYRPVGLLVGTAIVSCDGAFMFAGYSKEGTGSIYRLNGYNPVTVSTPSISRLMQNDANVQSNAITSFAWQKGGHAFANFSGTGWTRCWDAATQVWHSRNSYQQTTWRATHHMHAFGFNIVGDRLSGKLLYMNSDTYTEDSDPLIWGVDSPPLHVFPNGGIVDALHLDVATGYGTLSGQGSDPKIMLQTSTDGGNTFSNYRELELGVTGAYATRVTARRLGKFGPKGMVFRIRISDPVPRALVNVDVEVRKLKR